MKNPTAVRRWYFEAEDFEGGVEYLGGNGESIDYDDAKDTPFIGTDAEALAEGERRSNLWEDANNCCAASVTRHSLGVVQHENDKS